MILDELNENEKVVYNFLKTTNMNSEPSKWKDGYKSFCKEHKDLLSYTQFDECLLQLLNYHFCISLGYDFDTKIYSDFIITK